MFFLPPWRQGHVWNLHHGAGFEQRTKGFRTKGPKMFREMRGKEKKEATLRQQKVSFQNQIRRRLFVFVFETAGNSRRVSPAFFHLRSRNRWEASSNQAILLSAVDKNPINLLCRRCSFSFFFFFFFAFKRGRDKEDLLHETGIFKWLRFYAELMKEGETQLKFLKAWFWSCFCIWLRFHLFKRQGQTCWCLI